MDISIMKASMTYTKADGYVGNVEFQVTDHQQPYEITLYSRNNNEWMFGLHFLNESGSEENILAVEQFIDSDDECFEQLVQAAKDTFLRS